MMTNEVESPAMLNVLLGAMQTMQLAASCPEILGNGRCLYPENTRSEWISSDIIKTLFSKQISPNFESSSLFHTLPTGLWGLHKISSRVCLSILPIRSSKSKV